MKRADYARWKNHKKGKGFSLTELVIVIIIIAILALAVFAGGSAAIRKAKISRATSDLHNFDVALQTYTVRYAHQQGVPVYNTANME